MAGGSEGYLRPEAQVLSDESLIPPENEIRPPPSCFTHRVARDTPFYFGRQARPDAPDGHLAAGTKVLLMRRDSEARCRIADARGLYVEVDCASLTELENAQA